MIGVVLVLLLVAGGVGYFRSSSRLTQKYAVQVESVTLPRAPASNDHGKRLAHVFCSDCHGENLAGTVFFNDPAFGTVNAENLTCGKGGIGATYTDADWVRTLRHGVTPEGTTVLIMPADDYYSLSDQDLGDLIAFLKIAPAVDQAWPSENFTPLGHVLIGLGMFDPILIAERIKQTGPRPVAPVPGNTKEHGEYLVQINGCRSCHGQPLSGAKNPDPDVTLLAPNLTPGGELAAWSSADFIKTLHTGVTPSGDVMEKIMPWKSITSMTGAELKTVFLYLQSLPKLATTTQ